LVKHLILILMTTKNCIASNFIGCDWQSPVSYCHQNCNSLASIICIPPSCCVYFVAHPPIANETEQRNSHRYTNIVLISIVLAWYSRRRWCYHKVAAAAVDDCITTGRRRQYSSPTYYLLADLADTNYSIGGDATKRSRRSASTQETRRLSKCRSHHHGRRQRRVVAWGRAAGRRGGKRGGAPNFKY
jgi:hypothetical protein